MRIRTVSCLGMACALTFISAGSIRGEIEPDAAPEEPAAGEEFPWLCFAMSVGTLAGLYVLVRHRERQAEADQLRDGKPAAVCYCRACARDVNGSECPCCRAA